MELKIFLFTCRQLLIMTSCLLFLRGIDNLQLS